MKASDLSSLSRLTRAAFEAAQVRLSALRREEAELRRQIATLEEARQARAIDVRATDLAVRAGVDFRWESWIERRADLLSIEAARLRARIEMARDDLSQALGRRIAAQTLAELAQCSSVARRHAREERGS